MHGVLQNYVRRLPVQCLDLIHFSLLAMSSFMLNPSIPSSITNPAMLPT